ncbi:MAG: hypothetical protein ACOYL6_00640 [Bacteriovoracaceae bacterium]
MKTNTKSQIILTFTFLISGAVKAQSHQSTIGNLFESKSSWMDKVSMTYMSFFDGPGVFNDSNSVTPNALGKPSDDGLLLNNNVSLRYKMVDDYNLDLQLRAMYVMNNGTNTSSFDPLRWQSPRLGISTTFIKTENGKLTGAFNSDLPYFLPQPIGGGYIAGKRTTIATPGFFAKYSWTPKNTRWSLFSLVQPRFYIYKDRHVAEAQYSRAGYAPELKNELTLSFSPSANYAITDKLGFRLGTELIYKKLVLSTWNITDGSSKSADPKSRAWRIQPIPIQTGLTYVFSKYLEVSSFIQGYPIANERADKTGKRATFRDTLSVGAWISGAVF